MAIRNAHLGQSYPANSHLQISSSFQVLKAGKTDHNVLRDGDIFGFT
jgi:hypothetical protein